MINFFKRLLILLLFFNINFLSINCFTNLETKSKINCLDYKSNKNLNDKSSNYALAFKTAKNDKNHFYLIEFETDKKSTFMILVGEEQKFYDFLFFRNIKSKLSSKFRYLDLKTLNNELPLIWKNAKDLKCGDVISVDRSIELTVKNIISVKLTEKMNSVFFKEGNYIFYLSNLSGLPFDKSLIKSLFSFDSLLAATLGALFFGTIGVVGITFKSYIKDVLSPGLVAKGFSSRAKIGALEGLFAFWTLLFLFKYSDFLSEKLFNYLERNPEAIALFTLLGLYDKNPIPTLTQQGKVTVSKVDYLSKIMKQLNSLNISFAEIGFVNEKDFDEKKDDSLENFSTYLFFDEKLFDINGNPIKDDNGKVAHLFVVGNKGEK